MMGLRHSSVDLDFLITFLINSEPEIIYFPYERSLVLFFFNIKNWEKNQILNGGLLLIKRTPLLFSRFKPVGTGIWKGIT